MHHKQKNHYYTASKVACRLMSPIVPQLLFVYFLHYIFHILVCKKEFLSIYLFISNSFHLNIEVAVTHTNICWKALKELLKTEVVSFRSSTTHNVPKPERDVDIFVPRSWSPTFHGSLFQSNHYVYCVFPTLTYIKCIEESIRYTDTSSQNVKK